MDFFPGISQRYFLDFKWFFISILNPKNAVFWRWFSLVNFVFAYLEIYPEIQHFYTLFYRDLSRTPQHLRESSEVNSFQLLTYIKRNSIPDAAGGLHPSLILIQKCLISYTSRLFFLIKMVESRRPHFDFCYFHWWLFVTSVSYILHRRSSH